MKLKKIRPFIFPIIVFGLLIVFKNIIVSKIDQDQLQLTNLGIAIFSWLVLQIGFSFSIYAFIMTRNDVLFGKIKKTSPMRTFKRRLIKGYSVAMILSFFTFPFIVVKPDLYVSSWVGYILFATWFSASVYSFLYFFRTIKIFKVLTQVEDN